MKKTSDEVNLNNPVEKVVLYISQHISEPQQLSDLANHAGLSKFHFHRLFLDQTGYTPIAYLEKRRMEHAAHIMVLHPTWSLTEVAFDCGFSSPACFSRSFRKFYKNTPSKYRKLKALPKTKINPAPEKLNIQYLPGKLYFVRKVKLNTSTLNNVYQDMIRSGTNDVMGFYIDLPFHVPQEECRHYIGHQTKHKVKGEQSYHFPSGFYTSITFKGDYEEMYPRLLKLREQIQDNGYIIDSVIGYERVSLPSNDQDFDYFSCQREVFIKVRRR